MEIRAFYGESGLRNFEARNYMEKLDLDKLWIWRIYGDLDLVFFQYGDSGLSHFEAPISQGFQVHTMCSVFFLHNALMRVPYD